MVPVLVEEVVVLLVVLFMVPDVAAVVVLVPIDSSEHSKYCDMVSLIDLKNALVV